jgi:hypothetical protein
MAGWALGPLAHGRRNPAFIDWERGRVIPGTTWVDLQPSPDVMAEAQELHRIVLDAIGFPVVMEKFLALSTTHHHDRLISGG